MKRPTHPKCTPASARRIGVRGVSLIEALVALAVLAFGMLGIVGVQSALRMNSDVAKQRSEAVRLAQQAIEEARAFSVLAPEGVYTTYDGIVPSGGTVVATSNATFTRSLAVTEDSGQRRKTLSALVTWSDRTGNPQSISLATAVHRSDPRLAAALSVPPTGSLAQAPKNRHAAIPPGAVQIEGTGTSEFTPPGTTEKWTFSDSSGFITKICNPAGTCVTFTGFLLSGFVRYSTGATAPTPSDAENPTSLVSTMPTIGVEVVLTSPTTSTVPCFVESLPVALPTYVSYFCAVPVTAADPKYSGMSRITGLTLAASISDPSAAAARVCRYTPVRSHTTTTNAQHPLNYVDVAESLSQQNFLVIRAGTGAVPAFDCPDDGPSTLVNSTTFHHQPSI